MLKERSSSIAFLSAFERVLASLAPLATAPFVLPANPLKLLFERVPSKLKVLPLIPTASNKAERLPDFSTSKVPRIFTPLFSFIVLSEFVPIWDAISLGSSLIFKV